MDAWRILLVVGVVILIICFFSFIYVMIIAKKDGQVADPIKAEISLVAQTAGRILSTLKKQDRTAICRVSRGFTGIRVEVASSGEPPVHYDKEIPGKEHTAAQIQELIGFTATMIAHFAGREFMAIREYGDSFRVERNAFYRKPGQGGVL